MKITKVVITASGRVLIYRNGALVYSGIKTDKLTYSSADSMFSINGDFNFSYDKTPVVYDFDPNPPVTLDLTPTEFLDKMTAEVFNGTDAGSGGAGGGAATADKQDDQLAYLEQIDDTIGSNADTPVIDPSVLATHTALLKGLLSTLISGKQIGLFFVQAVDFGLIPNASIVRKSGKNFDVDAGTLPEHIWNGGGLYTGFPTTGPTDTLQVLSSSVTDIGTLTVIYLPSDTATEYITGTIPVNGTTPVNSTFQAYRVHSASYASTANIANQLNTGTITVRYTGTPATVFIAMPVGTNQSYMAGYTIPAGKKGFLYPTNWRVGGAAGNFVEGAMYIRLKNASPRLRRNCTPAFGSAVKDDYEGAIELPALTDIMPIIRTSNGNNIIVEAAYVIVLLPV